MRNVGSDRRLAQLRRDFQEVSGRRFDHFIKWTESPIEALLMGAMIASEWVYPEPAIWSVWYDRAIEFGVKRNARIMCGGEFLDFCIVQPELTIEGRDMRPDFAFFTYGCVGRIIVELDGHNFHERTPEQATRDKSKDRLLAAAGWTVLRFTGREVCADPYEVLREITRVAERMFDASEDRAQ